MVCSEDCSFNGEEYQLRLRSRQTLYGADNLAITLGYLS